MLTSQDFFERSQKVVPGGVHSPVRAFKSVGGSPVFFNFAKGAFLTSVEGKSYIDYCQSFGPNILGHLDSDVLIEVRRAIEEAWSIGACEPYSLRLAEWITNRLSFVEKIRFVCSGTEAVMSALRLARAYTGRTKILKFEGCYHGHVDSLLVKAGSGLATSGESDSAGVSADVARDTIVAQLNDESSAEEAFRLYGSEIAAVIIEPLPANFGLLIQRTEFLEKICELARQHGALVIFDEVISGFRVGLGGMAEALGIKPDIVTYGKIIGGGFPVGAYAGRKDIMDLMAPSGPVYQAGTLAANPVGMRAGLATLEKIERDNVYNILHERTTRFVSQLSDGFKKIDVPMSVAQAGSLFWPHVNLKGEMLRSPRQFDLEMKDRFKILFHECLDRGVYLPPSAFEVSFVSFAHTDEILSRTAEIILHSAQKAFASA